MRRRGVGRSLPRAHLQADLDIVTLPGTTPSETLLADAEAIRIVSEAGACFCMHVHLRLHLQEVALLHAL